METKIYMDNAATTPVHDEVLAAMLPYFKENYGNASGLYTIAKISKKALEGARKTVAEAIGANPEEIFFTGSGTESDNMAIRGVAEALRERGNHIITSAIEHHAVLHTCEYLEKHGFEVTYLPVDPYGKIDMKELTEAIRPETILISIMFANNEIGTIQPVEEIGKLAREKNILFHTDAVQAVGHVAIDVSAMQIDLLSMSGHKLGAPKGVGALYVKKQVPMIPLIHGGAQEKKMRAGTENVASIVALAKAIEISVSEMEKVTGQIRKLRDKLISEILEKIPYSQLNGHPTDRLPGNCNVSFRYIEGESILLMLDSMGVAASSGSACTSGSLDPSHVLLAIGLPHEVAHGSLRLTLDYLNTEEEVEYVLDKLTMIVEKLRKMSPLYDEIRRNDR